MEASQEVGAELLERSSVAGGSGSEPLRPPPPFCHRVRGGGTLAELWAAASLTVAPFRIVVGGGRTRHV
jgi:hypothetical protein